MRVLAAGFGLTVLVAAGLGWWKGEAALLPAAVMGGVATLIEVVAVRALRKGLAGRTTTEFFKGVGVGLLLRLAGVAVFAGLVVWNRDLFPPLAAGLAYIGVLIPLLFLEVRFVR